MLTDVYHSSIGTTAENELFFLVELVTVAELVVSAPPRSLQSAEPATGLPMLPLYHCCSTSALKINMVAA